MTKQFDLFGGAVNLAPVEERVGRILEMHPEVRASDKALILEVWLEEDGLADVLGDEALRERFCQWFTSQATFTESICRARRAIQSSGRCLPEREVQEHRQRQQERWRDNFRR